jgi:ABC-type sugar transport system permease subunit
VHHVPARLTYDVPVSARSPLKPLGWVLVLPAFALLLWSYVWPTVWNVWTSFRRVRLFTGDPDRNVGFANYDYAFQHGFWASVGYALTLVAVPLLVVAVAAPALAWAAHHGGTAARWIVRVALALPLVAYAPAAIAVGWALDHRGAGTVRPAAWWGTFGLGCAVAVTAYLAALRRRTPGRPAWPAAVVVGGLLALAAIALALQGFTYPYVISAGGPNNSTMTPMLLLFRNNFILASFGSGAAVATLLLIPLMLLGIAATVLVIATRLRIEVDPGYRSADEPRGWPPGRLVAIVATVVLLAIVLAVSLYGLWPWLSRLGDTTPPRGAGPALLNTWLPPLVSTTVGVGVALLAGLGIGAFRPLGRYSELLLLPFAPWLFVGTGPLLGSAFSRMAHDRQLGSFFGLVPPTWVAIPVLFVATLLFRGQEARWRAERGDVARFLVLPVLPMVPLLFGAVWLWQAQDMLWQLAASNPERPTAPAFLPGYAGYVPGHTGIGLVLPVALLVVFALLAIAAQLAYLDRVAVRVGRAALPTAPDLGYGQNRF